MRIQSFLSILLLSIPASLLGQEERTYFPKRNYFPVWSYHQANANIYGLSVGLGSFNTRPKNTTSNGIKIEIIGGGILVPLIPGGTVVATESDLQNIQPKYYSEIINGLNISTFGSFCECKTNGVSVGFIGHLVPQTNGISGAMFANLTDVHNGIQLAFLFNQSNIMNGIQLGFSNHSFKSNGLQIGLFNESKKMRGIQFGLWNKNGIRNLPIINWNFKEDAY